MLAYSISFLLGACIIQQFTALPSLLVFGLIPIIMLGTGIVKYRRNSLILIFFFGGAFVAVVHGQHYLDRILSDDLAGVDILINGTIVDIPKHNTHRQRFLVDVDSYQLLQTGRATESSKKKPPELSIFPERLLLSWYRQEREVHSGEIWQLVVRLKPPHGFLNPGGQDYEAWLYQQRVHATGYVRENERNRLIQASAYSIDRFRERIRENISRTMDGSQFIGLVTALAVGDKSAIKQSQWEDLRKTGTSHLMAISGLHIGLVAFFGFVMSRLLLPTCVMKVVPIQIASLSIGLCFAIIYAALAGFAIPTQRALIMLFGFVIAIISRRHHSAFDTFSLALFAIIAFDPVAVLSAGFWFSFLAVLVILSTIHFSKQKIERQRTELIESDHPFLTRSVRRLNSWGRLQIAISLVLLPASIYMFQQASIIAPIVNFIIIPVVSFIVVPLVLFGSVINLFYEPIAEYCFTCVDIILDIVWAFIHASAELPFADILHNPPSITAVLLAMIGAAILLFDSHSLRRMMGLLLFLPIFINPDVDMKDGEFRVSMLDVGQGLSVVVRTSQHVLLYDTGAKYSDSFDVGRIAVVPALTSMGIGKLDMLMISHVDNDHVGGMNTVLETYGAESILGSDIDKIHEKLSDRISENYDQKISQCRSGIEWEWDGVYFEMLNPVQESLSKRNERSCVLSVRSQHGSILLTGDIERIAESVLVRDTESTDYDVITIPHHGSSTSSSPRFLTSVNPEVALLSTGFRNRYRLPSERVMQRYRSRDIEVIDTVKSGAIELNFSQQSDSLQIKRYRQLNSRYWNHQAEAF